MPTIGDLVYILFLAICLWIAINASGDGGGGGKRARLPA